MVSMFTLDSPDPGSILWWCQIKDYRIGICCFSTTFRSRNKDWFLQNQDKSSHSSVVDYRILDQVYANQRLCNLYQQLYHQAPVLKNNGEYWQGHLNSFICPPPPPRSEQCTGANTYTTTHRNKTVNVDKIRHIFIVLVLPTKSVFKH